MDENVRVIICYDEDTLRETEYGRQIDELLRRYENVSAKVQVRFADLLKEPEIAQEYSGYGIQQGSILITSEQRTKAITLDDCIVREPDTGTTFLRMRSRS